MLRFSQKPDEDKQARVDMIALARDGNLQIREELILKHKCRVWTHEEIHALTFLMKHWKEYKKCLHRLVASVNSEPIVVPVDTCDTYAYVIGIGRLGDYYVIRGKLEDGCIQHWLVARGNLLVEGAKPRVLLHVDPWVGKVLNNGSERSET